jgi:hypothetical protein
MDVHIGEALCQNMDPIHNKQGNKITKFLCLARNMEREKQGSCSRKPVTAGGLRHTEYDRKVRPQTIKVEELYAQSEVLYFFFRDCHNKRRDHSRSCQFKPQIERNGKEIIPGNAGCMMVRK